MSDSVHSWGLALGSPGFGAPGSPASGGVRRGAWLALGQPFDVPGGSRVQGVWEPSLRGVWEGLGIQACWSEGREVFNLGWIQPRLAVGPALQGFSRCSNTGMTILVGAVLGCLLGAFLMAGYIGFRRRFWGMSEVHLNTDVQICAQDLQRMISGGGYGRLNRESWQQLRELVERIEHRGSLESVEVMVQRVVARMGPAPHTFQDARMLQALRVWLDELRSRIEPARLESGDDRTSDRAVVQALLDQGSGVRPETLRHMEDELASRRERHLELAREVIADMPGAFAVDQLEEAQRRLAGSGGVPPAEVDDDGVMLRVMAHTILAEWARDGVDHPFAAGLEEHPILVSTLEQLKRERPGATWGVLAEEAINRSLGRFAVECDIGAGCPTLWERLDSGA